MILEPWIDTAFVIDIETSGLDPFRNEVLTLSVSAVSIQDDRELDSELFLFKPENKAFWSAESESIHGISWEKAKLFEDKKKEWLRFIKFLSCYAHKPQIMVCHAMWFGKYFDSSFIDCQLDQIGLLFEKRKYIGRPFSTMTMAKELAKKNAIRTESFSLDSLAKIYGIELKHHDASSDREACQKLFIEFKNKGVTDVYTDPNHVPDLAPQKKKTSVKAKKDEKSNSKSDHRQPILG